MIIENHCFKSPLLKNKSARLEPHTKNAQLHCCNATSCTINRCRNRACVLPNQKARFWWREYKVTSHYNSIKTTIKRQYIFVELSIYSQKPPIVVIILYNYGPLWKPMAEKGVTQYQLLMDGIDNRTLDSLKKDGPLPLSRSAGCTGFWTARRMRSWKERKNDGGTVNVPRHSFSKILLV